MKCIVSSHVQMLPTSLTSLTYWYYMTKSKDYYMQVHFRIDQMLFVTHDNGWDTDRF